LTNPRRYAKFSRWVGIDLAKHPADRVVGFNKMPGLDVYFAADPCYEDQARTRSLRNPLYRISARYRHFSAYERAVFAAPGQTEILLISPLQKPLFQQYYGTPDARFHLLPPGICPRPAGAGRCPGNPGRIPPRVRSAGERSAVAADRFRLQDQGAGPQPEALAALPPRFAAVAG
jgi:UDP-glucose:(heptosyl)LPS alpha-1,3-glucosyltransferase